jgi:subtilase family serine protease
MNLRRSPVPAFVAIVGLSAIGALPAAAANRSRSVRLHGSASPVAASTPRVGSVAPSSVIDFQMQLTPRDVSGAEAVARAVSTPGNASYGRFLTPAQWEARFSPRSGQVSEVTAFLHKSGFAVHGVSADRMEISASGTAAQVEHVFATALAYHRVDGARLRLASRALSVPGSLSGIVVGVTGINEALAHPDYTGGGPSGSRTAAGTNAPNFPPGNSPPPPPATNIATPCGTYYNQIFDTTLPAYGNGYPHPPPWVTCGYKPPQFRSAYHLTGSSSGAGVTVAIVDAYASPTLFSDAQKYASLNDPSNPLASSQFSELLPPNFDHGDICGASGWYIEQSIDVEAVHATAPGAHILYAAAPDCATSPSLIDVDRRIIDGHLAQVITNSYGEPGDVTQGAGTRGADDNILLMAAGTGVSVMFSSGDGGDDFTTLGIVAPDYPASSPWATGIGGTTLQVGENRQRLGEFGWSTARSFLCNEAYVAAGGCTDAQLGTWTPIDLALDGGSGGGTSTVYRQPPYQAGVVPTSLSEVDGSQPMRVVPDISMDADPATGLLVGETYTFPDGAHYSQERWGGTSLASPLFAGVVARADETAGHALGFLNPLLYSLYGKRGALYDILPAGKQDESRADYVNGLNASQGTLYSTRIIDYEGEERFCASSGSCTTRTVALHTAAGYDNMTGLGSPGEDFVGDLDSAK